MLGNRGTMLRLAAHVENSAVHFGMQCLHAAVEHLGKAGEIGDVFHRDAGVAQQLGCASGGNQFDAHCIHPARKFHQPGLVGDAQDCSLNLSHDCLSMIFASAVVY